MAAQRTNNKIDDLFREALSQYEAEVPPYLWERIQTRLEQKRKNKILRIYISLAASIALIISMGIGFYLGQMRSKLEINPISQHKWKQATTSPKKNIKQNNQNTLNEYAENQYTNTSSKVVEVISPQKQLETNSVNTISHLKSDSTVAPLEQEIKDRHQAINTMNNRQFLCHYNDQKNIELKPINQTKNSESAKHFYDRFYLSFTGAPLYSYRMVNGVQANTLNRIEKPVITYSAGLNAVFVKGRIQGSLGLFFTQMAIRINDVIIIHSTQQSIYASNKTNDQQTVQLINAVGNVTPLSDNFVMNNIIAYQNPNQWYASNGVQRDEILGSTPNNEGFQVYKTYLTQKFNYVEIPFHIQYNLYQKRFTVGIQAGISFNYLISNAVYAPLNDTPTKVGRTSNLSKITTAGTLGISIAIPFGYRLSFLIEPRYRYYLRSVNQKTGIEAHPYSYGLYTGILLHY